MKKNKTLRAAGILFLATMLTTCMTAGTFAKYTTSDSAEDSARVAKFGVTVTADGTLFGEEYADADNGNKPINFSGDTNTGTVQVSAQGENVVAPGTRNDTGLGFTVAGKPEVDVQVTANANIDNGKIKDVYLKAGSYAVLSQVNNVTAENFEADNLYIFDAATYQHPESYSDTATYYKVVGNKVTFADDYYPIVYTYDGQTYSKIADIAADIDNLDATYQANTDLANEIGTKTITWEWDFNKDNDTDTKDTILGDIAANSIVVKTADNGTTYSAVTANDDYNLNVGFDMSITVDQID